MGTNLDDLKVTLSLDGAAFIITAQQAGKVVRSLSAQMDELGKGVNSIDRSMNSAAAGFRRFVITLGALRFIMMDIQDVFVSLPAAIIKSSGEVERMTKLMEGLSTQTSDTAKKLEAAQNTKFVFNLALNAPFEVKSIQDAFVKLKTAGIDPANGSLQALIDSVAKFGGTSDQLKRASIAIQQMGGKGVISMEELRQQLGEAVPNAIKLMAQGMGLSMAELVKKISKGTVEARSALAKMFLVMRLENQGAAKDMMDTWVGLTEQLKTRWTLFANQVGQSGFLAATKDAVAQLNKVLGDRETVVAAQNLGRALADITKALADMTLWAARNFDTVKNLAAGFALLIAAPKILGAISASYDRLTARAIAAASAQRLQQTSEAAYQATRLRMLAVSAEKEATANGARLTAANQVMRQLEAENRAHAARMLEIDRRYLVVRNGQWRDQDANRFISNAARNALIAERTAAQAQIISNNAAIASNVALANSSRQAEHQALMTAKGFHTQAQAVADAGHKFSILSGVMTAGRFVWAALGGWIGAITLALAVGIPMWLQWGNKGAEAIKKVRDAFDAGVASKEDVRIIEEQIAAKKQDLARLEREKQSAQSRPVGRGNTDSSPQNIRRLAKEIEGTTAELRALEAQIGKIKEQAQSNADNKVYSDIANEVATKGRDFAKSRAVIARGFMEEAEKLKTGSKEALALEKKAIEERMKADNDLLEFIVGRRQIAQEAARVGGSDAKKNLAAWQAEEDKVRQLIASSRGTFSAPNVEIASDKKVKKTPFESFIEAQQAKIADMRSDVERYSEDVVSLEDLWKSAERQVDALIANTSKLDGKDGAKPSSSQRNEAIEAIFSVDKLQIAKRGAAVLRDNLQQTTAAVQTAVENYDAAANVVGAQESITERMLKRLAPFSEAIQEELRNTGRTFEQFVQDITANAAKADALSFATGLIKQTKELEASINFDSRKKAVEDAQIEMDNATTIANHKIAALQKTLTAENDHAEQIIRVQNDLANYITARQNKLAFDIRGPIQRMAEEWSLLSDRMELAGAGWINNFVDTFVDGLEKGKFAFRDFATSILKEITKLMLQKAVSNFILQIGGMMSGSGSGSGMSFSNAAPNTPGVNFAKGGIMTPFGAASLAKYAKGGITPPRSPHVAIFGEGDMAEAYVPLPDGRRIPVNMQGNGGQAQAPSVQVNIINQTGQQADAKTSTRFDGKQMILDVVLSAVNSPGPFRDNMKNAMR